jgi:hypothetical protein
MSCALNDTDMLPADSFAVADVNEGVAGSGAFA